MSADEAPTGEIDTLTMTDATTGFMTADEGASPATIWTTHDGGRTWAPVQLS